MDTSPDRPDHDAAIAGQLAFAKQELAKVRGELPPGAYNALTALHTAVEHLAQRSGVEPRK